MSLEHTLTREVLYVNPDDSLRAASEAMQAWRIRHLPVLEGDKLVGILSDRDVLLHAQCDGPRVIVPERTVGQAMTEWPISISASTTVSKTAELMLEYKIDALPIVDSHKRLIGLVTSSDLLTLLIGRNESVDGRALPFSFHLKRSSLASVA